MSALPHLPIVLALLVLPGCVMTNSALEFTNTDFRPMQPGRWQFCVMENRNPTGCKTLFVEPKELNKAEFWRPDDPRRSTVTLEDLGHDRFIAQFTPSGSMFLLGRRTAKDEITLTIPSCEVMAKHGEVLARAGVQLEVLRGVECRPKAADLSSMRTFFELVATSHTPDDGVNMRLRLVEPAATQ